MFYTGRPTATLWKNSFQFHLGRPVYEYMYNVLGIFYPKKKNFLYIIVYYETLKYKFEKLYFIYLFIKNNYLSLY